MPKMCTFASGHRSLQKKTGGCSASQDGATASNLVLREKKESALAVSAKETGFRCSASQDRASGRE